MLSNHKVLITATSVAILLGVVISAINWASPRELSMSTIAVTAARVGSYVTQYGELPDSLEKLPTRANHESRISDGWDRKLIYKVEATGFSLTSLGKDGMAGGVDDDQDLFVEYQVVDGTVKELP